MATFQQMLDDLDLLGMSNLIQTDVGKLLNKVNREDVEAWDWSFLYTNITIWSVAPYTTGTLTLTTGSPQAVGGNGAAFTPTMAGWWISVGPTLTTPIIVQNFLDVTHLQLTTPWMGPNQVNVGYSIFPLYYDLYPIRTPFRVKQIAFLTQKSSEAINRTDPARLSTGGNPSLHWAHGPFTNDSPPHFTIELWPRCSNVLPYVVDGKVGPTDMINPNDYPQLPSSVIEAKASMYLARAVYASTGNDKWGGIAQMYQQDYVRELETARIEDNRRKVTLGVASRGSPGVNSGVDYWAIHDAAGPPYIGG